MTAATALVLAIAIVPGAFGSYLYEALNGLDWREKDWGAAIRYVAFSALGLIIYILFAAPLQWPPAIHVLPATYLAGGLPAGVASKLAIPFLGHLIGSGFAGLAAALGVRTLARYTRGTYHPGSWDAFARVSAAGRWVVVTLKSGDVFAGYLAVADTGVASNDRDLVLREPARLDKERDEYVATTYWEMYLPAALVQNLATVSSERDVRKGPMPGESLWQGGKK
ncbi:MAG TPA: DUF6338 family protein [Candidatus Saccharimonadaceae bacterium]|jgi:hypothetical protein|nr:DUF6338 family protein [Candidatus Saccharimonadaceae bacterium]